MLSDHLHSWAVAPKYAIHESAPPDPNVRQFDNGLTRPDHYPHYPQRSNSCTNMMNEGILHPTLAPNPDANVQATQYSYSAPYVPHDSYSSVSYARMSNLPGPLSSASSYPNSYADPHQNAPCAPPSAYPFAYHTGGSPSSWRDFTGSMALNQDSNTDYMSSTAMLMQLGSREEPGGTQELQRGVELQQNSVGETAAQTWPQMIFDPNNNAG